MNVSDLHRQAEKHLGMAAYSPRRWVLIHTAVSLGASLLMGLLNLLFSHMIAGTGGLSGLGTRSMLQTFQAVVELAVTVALPFWNISLIRAALLWARGESAGPSTLLDGFRLFRPVLRVKILTALVFLVVTIVVSNVGTMLFLFTPFSHSLTAALDPILAKTGYLSPDLLLTDEAIAQIGTAIIPFYIFFGVLFAAIAIPVWYRIRFADFAVMDGKRARVSMLESVRITKKKSLQVFKIDLSFWWFYLLQVLSVALCYGDSILQALGLTLPISPELAYVLFFAAGIFCQGLLLWRYQAKVSVTYALAYEHLTADAPIPNFQV